MSNPHCHRWGERTLRISAWIKGREEVKVLLLYTSLYYKLLCLLTMEFLSTKQHRLTSHYLMCHEGCYCFLSQRGDAYIHTMLMPVFKNFGQIAQFQPNLVVILRFHGCISLRMEASRENSCRLCPHFVRLQKNLSGWAPGVADPKPLFSPQAEFYGKQVSVCGVTRTWGPREKECPQSSSLASEFPRVPDLGKKDRSIGSKRMKIQIPLYFSSVIFLCMQ